jgi:hypothetical protein
MPFHGKINFPNFPDNPNAIAEAYGQTGNGTENDGNDNPGGDGQLAVNSDGLAK